MKKFIKEVLLPIIVVYLCFMVLLSILILPFAYFEGTAKSEYLKEQKGIEMHWYRAAWLPDQVFIDVKANVDALSD